MSTPRSFSWLPVRELVKDAAGAYTGLYLFKGPATAMHHIVLYMVADVAYVYFLRAKILPQILNFSPLYTSDDMSIDMRGQDWSTILKDYGAKILFTTAVDIGYEFARGRDAFLKKIGYSIVMNLSAFATNHVINYIDSKLPESMEGYINS